MLQSPLLAAPIASHHSVNCICDCVVHSNSAKRTPPLSSPARCGSPCAQWTPNPSSRPATPTDDVSPLWAACMCSQFCRATNSRSSARESCVSHDDLEEFTTAPATSSTTARPFEGKTVVMLRTSSTARAAAYLRLKELGMKVIMVHPFESAHPNFPAIEDWITLDTTDVEGISKAIRARGEPIHAITSFDEYGVFPAAKLAREFGFPSLPVSPAMLSTINIKSRFRTFCSEQGLSAPRYAALRDPSVDPVEVVRRAGLIYPLISKPAPGAGSNLVQLCDTEADLVACVAKQWRAIDAMRPTARHFEVLGEPIHILLEEFAEGDEVDIDAIVEHGVIKFAAVSDNFETERPYFSELGGVCPSQLTNEKQHALVRQLELFVDACNRVDDQPLHGVLHFEAKYDTRRNCAVIIEVNCRMGSAETRTMVQTAFGVDLGEASLRLALNMPLQPLPTTHVLGQPAMATTGKICASANLYPSRTGTLTALGLPSAADHPTYVTALPFPVTIGDVVRPPPETSGCLIWLVAASATLADAMAGMKALSAAARIAIE